MDADSANSNIASKQKLMGAADFCGFPFDGFARPQSFFPITWPPIEVGYRNNAKSMRFNLIN